MKVKATQAVEVTLSEDEVWRVTRDFLFAQYDWKQKYQVIGDKVFRRVLYDSPSYSWEEDEFVRDASPDDKAFYSVFCKLEMDYASRKLKIQHA